MPLSETAALYDRRSKRRLPRRISPPVSRIHPTMAECPQPSVDRLNIHRPLVRVLQTPLSTHAPRLIPLISNTPVIPTVRSRSSTLRICSRPSSIRCPFSLRQTSFAKPITPAQPLCRVSLSAQPRASVQLAPNAAASLLAPHDPRSARSALFRTSASSAASRPIMRRTTNPAAPHPFSLRQTPPVYAFRVQPPPRQSPSAFKKRLRSSPRRRQCCMPSPISTFFTWP